VREETLNFLSADELPELDSEATRSYFMFDNGMAWDFKERKAVIGQPSMMISFQCP